MIVAVTGANGFIGSHLVARIAERGWLARSVVRRDIESGEVRRLFDGADVVVHAAGATRAPTRAQLEASNIVLTARILDEAKRAKVRRFVYVSSQAAAGPAGALSEVTTEEAEPTPCDAYGQTKLDAERRVQASGVDFVIARPVATYGPRDRDFLALFRLAHRGVAIHAANRDHWLSVIHVRDLVDGLLACAEHECAAGKAFFLSGREPVQWRMLFQAAATAAQRRLVVDMNLPGLVVDVGARLGDVAAKLTGRAGLLTTEKVKLSKPKFWVCSGERAQRELDFRARMSIDAGFAQTYDWYRTNGWL